MPHQTKTPRRKKDELCPDGVLIKLDWDTFDPGSSMFIPAVNTDKLHYQIMTAARDKGMKIKGFERIEGGLLGMRFWRIS